MLHSEDSWDFRQWQNGYSYLGGMERGSFWNYEPPTAEWGWFNEKPGPSYYKERYMYLTWNWNPPLKKVFFERAEVIFADALKQVAGNKELQHRIEVLEMPVYFAAILYLPGDHPFFQKAKREFLPFVDRITSEYPLNKTKMDIIVDKNVERLIKEKTGTH